MKFIKRIFLAFGAFVVISVLLTVGMGIYFALTDDGEESSRLIFELNEDGQSYYVLSIEEEAESVEIPATYKSSMGGDRALPVTAIGDEAFQERSFIRSVTIPDSVKHIGYQAFMNCTALEEVIFEEGSQLESIDDEAFKGCEELKNITISDGIKSVGSGAFEGCKDLKFNEYGNVGYLGCEENPYVLLVCATHKSITSCKIHKDTRVFCEEAFRGCSYLAEALFEEGGRYTSLSERMFNGCTSLSSVSIPNNVTELGGDIFINCTGLKSVTLPKVIKCTSSVFENGVTLYYNGTLDDWCRLELTGEDCVSPAINAAQVFLKDSSNHYYSPKEIKIPNTITEIQNGQFLGFDTLTSVVIGENVKSIGDSAFEALPLLESVTIGSEVKYVGENAFNGCSALKTVTLAENSKLEEIGENAFYGCSMEELVLSGNLKKIGMGAFYECEQIKEVYIQGTLADWCDIQFDCKDFFEGTNPVEYSRSLNVKNEEGEYEQVTDIVLPDGVKAIGDIQFHGLSVGSLTISKSVTAFEDGALWNFKVENVYYQGKIADWCKIRFGAMEANPIVCATQFFMWNDEGEYAPLETVVLPEGLTEIGDYQFAGGETIVSLQIPNTVKRIGGGAFYDCIGLTSVEIPKSVTEISSDSFLGCENLQYTEYNNARYLGNAENPYYAFIGIKEYASEGYEVHEATKVIANFAFDGCNGGKIILPDNVEYIGAYAFENCSLWNGKTFENGYYIGSKSNPYMVLVGVIDYGVTSMQIHMNTKFIAEGAVQYCSDLESIIIPRGVLEIKEQAFSNCSALKEVVFEAGARLRSVGDKAFADCESLSPFDFPSSVVEMGEEIFWKTVEEPIEGEEEIV